MLPAGLVARDSPANDGRIYISACGAIAIIVSKNSGFVQQGIRLRAKKNRRACDDPLLKQSIGNADRGSPCGGTGVCLVRVHGLK